MKIVESLAKAKVKLFEAEDYYFMFNRITARQIFVSNH
jgi:hypothetical protein